MIDEKYAVFASPNGDDTTADGSRKTPFKTLGAALAAAKSANKRVYACADGAPFTESLTFGAELDGSQMFGGFHCDSWAYQSGLLTPIHATTPTAITVSGLTSGLLIEDFDITASNATKAGDSSFAALVTGSQSVVFRRTHLTAGNGGTGDAGTDGTAGANAAVPAAAQNGANATCPPNIASRTGGAASTASTCGSRGGNGGGGVVQVRTCTSVPYGNSVQDAAGSGAAGTPNTNLQSTTGGNPGQGQSAVTICGPGSEIDVASAKGSDGGAGANGTLGSQAAAVGVFSESGYSTADGSSGADGYTGQGGGGGGGALGTATCAGPSGAAGGMGGCGGTHATGGHGGGASIAVLAWFSNVTLDSCVITAGIGGAGGKGGNGGTGGIGQAGGTAGAPASSGGKGGNGGDGGSGSGGTGGPSMALVYHGTAPKQLNNTSLNTGTGGAKGAGGIVNNRPAQDGSVGQVAPLYEQK